MTRHLAGTGFIAAAALLLCAATAHAHGGARWSATIESSTQFYPAPPRYYTPPQYSPYYPPPTYRYYQPTPPPGAMPPPVNIYPPSQFSYGAPPSAFAPAPPPSSPPPVYPQMVPSPQFIDPRRPDWSWRERHGGFDHRDRDRRWDGDWNGRRDGRRDNWDGRRDRR